MLQKLAIAIALIFTATITSAASDDSIYTKWSNNKAVGGYDTVEYFKSGVPTKGDKKLTTVYKDTEWFFASQENLDLFVADPMKYAPQYGGYCAWAMAGGNAAKGDPKQWAIVDGKLYLNYDRSIKKKWDADRPGFIVKADVVYPKKFTDDE
ncbi:MAG: YHS domain-containing protein [Kordiimonadaceae bacterium]|nr:YHS domain-containing protein [Kordiimonadaceae bacterium]